jgi:hypothetical protein
MAYSDEYGSDLQDYINDTLLPGGDRLDYSKPVDPKTAPTYNYGPGAGYDEGGNYRPDPLTNPKPAAAPAPAPQQPSGGRSMDDAYILGIIGQWAGMPGADPSLGGDPGYWLKRIKETGGLGSDNMDFWMKAGVGDTAFFRNPNRESGGTNQLSGVQGRTGFEQFDDPSASLLERLALDRVERLSQTPDRSQLDAYTRMLQEKEAANQRRAQEFATSARARASELKGPAFSDQDEAVLRAKSFDKLEQRRAQTLKNEREGVFLRGFAPTSGIVKGAERDVNNRFETQRTGIESNLLQYMMEETQRRKDRALNLEQLAQQALEGGDVSSLQMMAQLAELEDSMINEADQRERERLASAGIPVDLANSRTQLALQILGQGGNPESVMNSLLGIGQLGLNSRQLNIQNKGSNLSGLGQLGSLAINALGLL